MAFSEIDSFVYKFKNLLIGGANASLTLKSEAGKALVTLTAEVNILPPPSNPHQHDGARHRRRLRRAADRAAAAETDISEKEVAVEQLEKVKVAEEAGKGNAVLVEPIDEINIEEISSEILPRKDYCAILSIIPMRHLNSKDEDLKRAIRNKIEAKDVKVKNLIIQRSVQGTFTRCDAIIEPTKGTVIEEISFEFGNCRVEPFYGFSCPRHPHNYS